MALATRAALIINAHSITSIIDGPETGTENVRCDAEDARTADSQALVYGYGDSAARGEERVQAQPRVRPLGTVVQAALQVVSDTGITGG